MKNTSVLAICAALALASGAFFVGRAIAIGGPVQTPLTWSGIVTDQGGKPYANAVDVTVSLYDAPAAGALKCKAATVQAEAGTGRFSVVLPGNCADAVHATADLWSELAVGPGQSVMPRVHVGAMPYALEAYSASKAAAATGALQATIDGLKADVAALKAGGGGGAIAGMVVDGAGVSLGHLLYIVPAGGPSDPEHWRILTKTGAIIDLTVEGKIYQNLAVAWAYDGPNCGGQPFWRNGSATWFQNYVVYEASWQFLYVTVAKSGNYAVADLINPIASCKYNGCNNNNGCNQAPGMYKLKKTTLADVGLPDVITDGLSLKGF